MIETADKVRLIDCLSHTGLKRLEVTSFVRPDVIPQLADAEQVLSSIERVPGVSYTVLIPNEKGLERALRVSEDAGERLFDEVNLFLSASETHNRKNVNRSVEESLAGLERVIAQARRGGAALRGRDLGLVRLSLRGRGSRAARVRDRKTPGGRGLRGDRLRRYHRDGQSRPRCAPSSSTREPSYRSPS